MQGAAVGLRELGKGAISLLDRGFSAEAVVSSLVKLDVDREEHQFHVISSDGGSSSAHTGGHCPKWAGHANAANVSVAGNTLAGPQVLNAMLDAFKGSAHLPFEQQLFAAISAGEVAGGDRRGVRSVVLATGERIWRVDNSAAPMKELAVRVGGQVIGARGEALQKQIFQTILGG